MAFLNMDYQYKPKGFETSFTIPKGTRITHKTACGIDPNYNFIDEFGWIPKEYSILKHDAMYRGINIPPEFVTE